MTVNPIVINQNKDIEETIDLINKNRISMIPVVEDDERIIGICSRYDILKEILNERFVVIGRKKTTTTTIGEGWELWRIYLL